jgi:C4-dicarboxylate transporter DctQ subunit
MNWKWLDRVEEIILIFSLAIMSILTFANVISRYFLHASISSTEEITTNLIVLSTFIGAAAAARRGAHLGLSVFTDNLPLVWKRATILVAMVSSTIVFVLLIVSGYDMVLSQKEYMQLTPALGWPTWILNLSVPVGALFCLVRFNQAGWKEWQQAGREGTKA